MIDWQIYDPKTPPALDKNYLVSDGHDVTTAWFMDSGSGAEEDEGWDRLRFYPPDCSNLCHEDIRFCAEIDLPSQTVNRDERVIRGFIERLRIMSGTGNGIGVSTVEKIRQFAIREGFITEQPRVTQHE